MKTNIISINTYKGTIADPNEIFKIYTFYLRIMGNNTFYLRTIGNKD